MAGAIEADDFKAIKIECNDKITVLEARLFTRRQEEPDLTSLWKNAISRLSDIHIVYEQGTIEERRRIIGSMFPEKLVFDGTSNH